MVNVSLGEGEVNSCPDPGAMLRGGLQGGFKTLVALQDASRASSARLGPLDKVSVETYVRMWKKAGARVGRVQGSMIVWENLGGQP
jgi:hypothetical protein